MTSTKPEIDQLTGTVISEQGGGEIVDGRQDPPMSVYADDDSADGAVTPSLLATEPEAPTEDSDRRQERLAALVAEGAVVYALIYDAVVRTSELVADEDGKGEELYADRYRVVNSAFASWLGVTV